MAVALLYRGMHYGSYKSERHGGKFVRVNANHASVIENHLAKIRRPLEKAGATISTVLACTHQSDVVQDWLKNVEASHSEVIQTQQIADDTIIVNVQGDEPFVPADNIRQVAANLAANPAMQMATLCTPIAHEDDVFNPNIVKVVFSASGKALYFSRSVLPFARDTMMQPPVSADPGLYYRHIGLYGYKKEMLMKLNEVIFFD